MKLNEPDTQSLTLTCAVWKVHEDVVAFEITVRNPMLLQVRYALQQLGEQQTPGVSADAVGAQVLSQSHGVPVKSRCSLNAAEMGVGRSVKSKTFNHPSQGNSA